MSRGLGDVYKRQRRVPCDKSKAYDSNDVLLVRASSLRPKAGTWYLKRSKKLLFSSRSSHVECNSFSTRLQQRKPGAGSSRRYFCAVWLRKRSERYRSWTSEAKLHKKVLPSLPTTCLLLTVTGDASNHGKRPRRHNLRPWGTYMTTCYQSMVHVKSLSLIHISEPTRH